MRNISRGISSFLHGPGTSRILQRAPDGWGFLDTVLPVLGAPAQNLGKAPSPVDASPKVEGGPR